MTPAAESLGRAVSWISAFKSLNSLKRVFISFLLFPHYLPSSWPAAPVFGAYMSIVFSASWVIRFHAWPSLDSRTPGYSHVDLELDKSATNPPFHTIQTFGAGVGL